MQNKLLIYHTQNEKALKFIFRVTAIFTLIGYGSDTPRSFIEGEYLNVVLNTYLIALCALIVILNSINKISVRWAAAILCYSQLLVSILSVTLLIYSQTFSEKSYAIEVVLHMIYIGVMGFIIAPKHAFYYGGVALVMNVILLVLYFGKDSFDMLPLFTSIIPGFTLGMYHFSKSSIRSFSDSYLRAGIIEEQKEEIVKLGQFRQDMTNMVAHDLKNPLSFLLNIDLISDSKQKNDIIKYSGHKMMNLVQNMLDVSKYETTKMALNKEDVKPLGIFNLAKNELEFFSKEKHIEYKLEIEKNTTVAADSDILLRVFSNLLSNAIKFSPSNGIITFKVQVLNHKKHRISLHNQGYHIPKEKQSEIFKRFGQAEKQSIGNVQSTGLGLTFCKMAIESHGGEIGVISEEGKGAEFWFTLQGKVISQIDDVLKKAELNVIELSSSDMECLAEYACMLAQYQVYEITALNQIIKKIDKRSIGIINWVKDLEKAIYSSNQKVFDELINNVQKHSTNYISSGNGKDTYQS